MSQSQHTPGPWEVKADAHDRGRIMANGQWIASTWKADESNDGSGKPAIPALANAALIAAAPDLLAACEKLLNCPDTNLDELDPITMAAIEAARAAIAKAKGAP